MNQFNEIMTENYKKVAIGVKAIKLSFEKNAIDLLMYTDDYIKKLNSNHRIEFLKMIGKIKEGGGHIVKMSSRHATGESKLALFNC